MGKIVKIKDFITKRQDRVMKEYTTEIDRQFNEVFEGGWCGKCNIITSDIHEVDSEWLCSDCLKIGPFDIGA